MKEAGPGGGIRPRAALAIGEVSPHFLEQPILDASNEVMAYAMSVASNCAVVIHCCLGRSGYDGGQGRCCRAGGQAFCASASRAS